MSVEVDLGGAIGWGKLLSEANIQAEFYHQCRLLSIPCILEFSTNAGRHDCCVFDSTLSRLLAIVECKLRPSAVDPKSDQILRYKTVGVPVYGLCRLATHMAASNSWPSVLVVDLKHVPRIARRVPKKKITCVYLDEDLTVRV